jgi:hypothetical protein
MFTENSPSTGQWLNRIAFYQPHIRKMWRTMVTRAEEEIEDHNTIGLTR